MPILPDQTFPIEPFNDDDFGQLEIAKKERDDVLDLVRRIFDNMKPDVVIAHLF